ncbi:F-box/FBD/LRR-repeat protein At3g26920-like [Triticum dicoccoides]|uniref:F-box/FBD/LRR-repeat protein At3g26920-like n=1 Tax=Triticum dicoccoides TaxID=85692 RepID=UPI000E7CBDB4|nr:F-box/FBD/LRR-repeat protein At3g26920-like [Triticum dicoccoides]
MDTRVPPVPMDPATALMFRLDGQDPEEMEALFARVLSYTHYALPDPPVSVDARLCALLPHHSVDGVSRLPDVLLRNIVSRLPVKEGARTAALSRRWRGVWRSAPLVLVDSHILPAAAATAAAGTAAARGDARRITSAVSRILAAHPGPFRCVHLTSSHMEEFHGMLTRWLHILANKGIQELVLVNRPWPLDLVLPSTFLGMTTLTRLYLGLWKFPDTAGIPSATCFPNLLELGLCSLVMESKDLDFILDRSPVLETLYIHGNLFKLSLRLVSQSLRCVKILMSSFEEIAVVDAPRLERLILTGCWSRGGVCTKVKIGYAPKLHSLGYLDSGSHVLEFGDTVIKAGTKVSPSTMVPSVRVLALEVRCGVRNDVKMTPTVLRCFPNVETLHIMSGKTGQPSGKHNLKFWNESGTIECISSRINLLVFHDFRGDRSELAFLKFFFESALVLKHVVIVLANAWFTSMEDMHSKVNPLRSMKRASAGSKIMVTGCSDPEDGGMGNFKRASGSSVGDPFVNF